MLKDIIIAIQAYGHAHRFIKHHQLWKWIIIPGIIYGLLFCVSMWLFGQSASSVIEFISIKIGLRSWVASLKSSFIGFLFTVGGIMLWLVLMLFYFSLFKYLWLIVGSPIFAYLSEKTASIQAGKEFPFEPTQLLKDILRGITISLRNTLWQTVYLITFMIIALIPVIGWVTPVFVVLVECYYYGFSMLDYSSERNRLSVFESIRFISHRRGLAIGNGIGFYLMHLLPFVGWVLAPAYAVIAATLSVHPSQSISSQSPPVPPVLRSK